MLQINNCRVVGFVVLWIFILFYLFIAENKNHEEIRGGESPVSIQSSLRKHTEVISPVDLQKKKKKGEATAGKGKVWSLGKCKKEKQVQNKA